MNKAFGITASTFTELIDSINKFAETHKVFSTQFLEPDRNTFYCVVWYESIEPQKPAYKPQNKESGPITNSDKITEKQLKRILSWSKTEPGMSFLKSKKIFTEDDVLKLSKEQAKKIISEGYELQK